MNIQHNIEIAPMTTFKVGGRARYFATANSAKELQDLLVWAHTENQKYFILGGGSNLIFTSATFNGLVVKPEFLQFSLDGTEVTVGASVLLADVLTKALDAGLTGFEFAAGIPGTVGGAVRGNAGTYGVGMGDVTSRVTALNCENRIIESLKREQCAFHYRDSIFKHADYVITDCVINLQHGDLVASRKLVEERIAKRVSTHPTEPSAGCIFKNIEFDTVDTNALSKKGVDIKRFSEFKKIPSGYLIEQLGLKGKSIGGAQISAKHANYIINTGSATFEDVITLISYIKQQVRDTYGVQLEEEAQIVT